MRIIYWLPRILSILFILFLSLFSFDVFSEYNGWDIVLPLLMHLIPSFVLLGITLVAWKYDLVGAISFLGSGLFYILLVGLDRHWSWYIGISGPAIIIGMLFAWNWFRVKIRPEIK